MKKLPAVVAAMVVVVLAAGPAFAHVTVDPSEAAQGGYTTFTFKVPNERPDAMTTQVELDLPAADPIASVSLEPVPGWTATVEKVAVPKSPQTSDARVTEGVSKITWTGGEIKPGEFQQFPVSMGPLPSTDQIVFKALQTYSNGEVVRWIQLTPAGGKEPENPAPIVTLEKAAAGADHHAHAAADETGASSSGSHDSSNSEALAIVAIGVAGLGAILAVVALARSARSKTT